MSKKQSNNIDDLVQRAKEGDAEAFGRIYDELVKPVYRYIYYRVAPDIAEDLTEDTFLKAWQNLRQYKRGKHPFSAWVFRIAHNLVCDHYRKDQSFAEMDENIADTAETGNPAFQLNVQFNQVKLREAIRKLPENYQQVIVLKYVNELENAEIAKVISKSEGTVRTIQFRALQKLRSMLSEKRRDF